MIDIYTRLEVLLGLNLSGHTDTLTEASTLIDELYIRRKIQDEQQYRNPLNKLSTLSTEPSSKISEQIAYDTRPEIEKHMLIVLDKSTHGEHLSQQLQTNNNQFKIAVTFLTGYNGIFNIPNSNKKIYFAKSYTDEDGFIQVTIPKSAYEIKSLSNEDKRTFIEEEHYTEANYPFTVKSHFSTVGSILEISTQGPVITFCTR